MTVEADINALNTTVTNLDNEIKTNKARLDAFETDAEALKNDAAVFSTLASDKVTEGNTLKTAVQAYSTAIGSASPIVDLTSILDSKSVSAVDVFVYDTSKDSDGGAWRYKTQGTSWYNETLNTSTRGSRREFPSVAVIVVESIMVTIYDGDDPSLPMWMVLAGSNSALNLPWSGSGSAFSGVAALNGIVALSSTVNNGLAEVRFVADTGYVRNFYSAGFYNGNIAQRHASLGYSYTGVASDKIANQAAYDVAMTVLPDAPIDPATGLPVPTIAVATGGGVSVITHTGLVYDGSWPNYVGNVAFDKRGSLWWTRGVDFVYLSETYSSDGHGTAIGRVYSTHAVTLTSPAGKLVATDGGFSNGHTSFYSASNSIAGLMRHQANYTDFTKGISTSITSTYNTGWMLGDVKLAALASIDQTALVKTNEFIVNGTFDTDTSWTVAPDYSDSEYTISGGILRVDAVSTFGEVRSEPLTGLTVGQTYHASADVLAHSGTYFLMLSTSPTSDGNNRVGIQWSSGLGTRSFSFTASATTMYFWVATGSGSTAYIEVDNISVVAGDADRSYEKKGLIANGTITRSPVAEGAELVGYSGFSADNYLEQPYNSDLDFGTGDFSIMGWFDIYNAYQDIFTRAEPTGLSAGAWRLYNHAAGVLRFYWHNGTSEVYVAQTTTPLYNQYTFLVIKKESSVLSIYQDNKLLVQFPHTDSLTCNGAVFSTKGCDLRTKLALLRISATAPTTGQIRKIYEDERVLFQPGAKCTLYGTTDGVAGLAYDPDTDHLHVGTSQGRSTFKGLRRVSYSDTAVGTAISAAKGMVVDE